jgi:hypothetical protein
VGQAAQKGVEWTEEEAKYLEEPWVTSVIQLKMESGVNIALKLKIRSQGRSRICMKRYQIQLENKSL